MAKFPKNVTLNVDVDLKISDSTAELCRDILERYWNQHPELDLIGQRQNDDTIKLNFKRKGQAEP